MSERIGPVKSRSAKSTIKAKLLVGSSLALVLAGVVFAIYLTALEVQTPPTDNSPAAQPQVILPSTPDHQESPGERVPEIGALKKGSSIEGVAESPAARSGSTLQKAELEHLKDVFLNSVYPLFQYDFNLNPEGRSAIDVFVASMPEGLGSEDLEAISGMIETQLLSPEAEDLAFIITHLYRLEQEEARLMSEGEAVTTMEGQLAAQKRLSRLRDEWFGAELSERLFSGAEDAPTSSVPGTSEDPPDDATTDEPPEAVTGEQSELADIESACESRYQQFLAEKQVIDRAGLDQSEKDRQIETLLQQHYTPQELEAARAYHELRK